MDSTERMTDRARRVMERAEEEARRRGAAAVEPEHLLLGLALEWNGVGAYALRSLGASAERIAKELPATAPARASGTAPLPWSAGILRAVARANVESLEPLGHNYVGTEHLALGVVLSAEGAVVEILARIGVIAEDVRREVYSILGHEV